MGIDVDTGGIFGCRLFFMEIIGGTVRCTGLSRSQMCMNQKWSSDMKSKIKIEKASKCFSRLYGRAAYEAWKTREAEIDGLAKSGQYSVSSICHLREDNYRHMKSGKSGIVSGKTLRHHRLAA